MVKCLDSIRAQSFSDWECLLIDDGSPDSSGDICERYAQVDSRFHVYHKENGGVSSARNVGLDHASGCWICFCDSDDWVGNHWLSDFHSAPESDIIIAGFTAINWNGEKNPTVIKQRSLSGCFPQDKKACYDELLRTLNLGYTQFRMFRKSIIDQMNLRFNTAYKLREDEAFISHYMTAVQSFTFIASAEYHYIAPDFGAKYNQLDINSLFECNKEIAACTYSTLQSYAHPIYSLYVSHCISYIRRSAACKQNVRLMLDWLVPLFYSIPKDIRGATPNCIRLNRFRGFYTNILNYIIYGILSKK